MERRDLLKYLISSGLPPHSKIDACSPELYFYPPPIHFEGAQPFSSPMTISIEQATTLFPFIEEMSGVIVMLNWSQICQNSNKVDFTIIMSILEYWGKRDRKVVLGISTIGFPYISPILPKQYTSCTPEWLMERVKSYRADTLAFGWIGGVNRSSSIFPSYKDLNFVNEIQILVDQIRLLDGHDTISCIRISTGFIAEDNPSPFGDRYAERTYNDSDWIGYCSDMLNIYQAAFKKTQIEFDWGMVGIIATRGDETAKQAANLFANTLTASNTFEAFNGLSSLMLPNNPSSTSRDEIRWIVKQLLRTKQSSKGFGLEALEPMTGEAMLDIDGLLSVVQALNPTRLNFFFDVAGVINWQRQGENETNKLSLDWVRAQPRHERAITNIDKLLASIYKSGLTGGCND